MNVNVRYFAAAADYAGTDAENLALEQGATVKDLVSSISADRSDDDRLTRVLDLASFLVNGKRADLTDAVPADAQVDVLPPFAGG